MRRREAGIWRCSSGRASVAARGTNSHVGVQQQMGIWSGRTIMAVRGTPAQYMLACGGRAAGGGHLDVMLQ
ncbi:hypothetical protein CYMTET_11843 [Cymbomonas tetramitiformis]|uniref:Uncharacterized protein n=1 Tax=Cymbomonas tetramitiformis TaxID=36881 RepID=A0AAE0GLW3_9CHLO|nr:hypothetical protein CYMTET_11843 [Cymbomonas tetramitiformis]